MKYVLAATASSEIVPEIARRVGGVQNFRVVSGLPCQIKRGVISKLYEVIKSVSGFRIIKRSALLYLYCQ